MNKEECLKRVLEDLRFFLEIRHMPITPWMGGYVYPKDEIKNIIRDLRKAGYRNGKIMDISAIVKSAEDLLIDNDASCSSLQNAIRQLKWIEIRAEGNDRTKLVDLINKMQQKMMHTKADEDT
jgi:hypothetical protein